MVPARRVCLVNCSTPTWFIVLQHVLRYVLQGLMDPGVDVDPAIATANATVTVQAVLVVPSTAWIHQRALAVRTGRWLFAMKAAGPCACCDRHACCACRVHWAAIANVSSDFHCCSRNHCCLLQVMRAFADWSASIANGSINPTTQNRLWEVLSTPTESSTRSGSGSSGWRLLPAADGSWVSLLDGPLVPNDGLLADLFSGVLGVSFLQLPQQLEGPKRAAAGRRKTGMGGGACTPGTIYLPVVGSGLVQGSNGVHSVEWLCA